MCSVNWRNVHSAAFLREDFFHLREKTADFDGFFGYRLWKKLWRMWKTPVQRFPKKYYGFGYVNLFLCFSARPTLFPFAKKRREAPGQTRRAGANTAAAGGAIRAETGTSKGGGRIRTAAAAHIPTYRPEPGFAMGESCRGENGSLFPGRPAKRKGRLEVM